MKISFRTTDGKNVFYDESIWTGKRIIKIDGYPLTKVKKNIYALGEKQYTLKGSYMFGVSLESADEKIVIVRKLNVLEYIFTILPLIMVFIGGVVGALTGFFSALLFVTNARKIYNVFVKILLGIGCTALAVIGYLMVVLYLFG